MEDMGIVPILFGVSNCEPPGTRFLAPSSDLTGRQAVTIHQPWR